MSLELILNPYVNNGILGAIFLFLFLFFYSLMHSIQFMQSTKRSLERLYRNLHDRDRERVLRREMIGETGFGMKAKQGTVQRILSRMDDTIAYSNVKERFPWLDTSVFVAGTFVVTSLAFSVALTTMKNMLLAMMLSCIPAICPYVALKLLALWNYRRTEAQLTMFVDMISSNAAATNNLITVLENTAEYMEPPVSSAIYRAVSTATVTGSSERGIAQLIRELEHPSFVTLIRNLEICSRNDANYHKIAMDAGSIIHDDLKFMEKCRSILAGGRKQILMLWILELAAVCIGCRLFGNGLEEMIGQMLHSTFGSIVLAVELLLNGSTFLFLIIGMNQ